MRKFTFLFCLLMLSVCTQVNAQFSKKITEIKDALTSVETFTDGYYLLWNIRGTGGCVRENTADNWLVIKGYDKDDFIANATGREIRESVIYVTKDPTEGTFKFQFQSGNYMGQLAMWGGNHYSSASAETFTIESIDDVDKFAIKGSNGVYANSNGPGGGFVGWGTSKPNATGNGVYKIIPITVEDYDKVDYVFKHKVGSQVFRSEVIEYTLNTAYEYTTNASNLNFASSVTPASFSGTVSLTGRIHEIEYVLELPFETTTLDGNGNFTSTPKFYQLKIQGENYLKFIPHATTPSESEVRADRSMNGEYDKTCLWYFVEKGFSNRAVIVNAYCLAAAKPLGVTKNGGEGYLANFARDEASGEVSNNFEVIKNGDGFSLAYPGTSRALNKYSNVLKIWANGDPSTSDGNRISVVAVSEDGITAYTNNGTNPEGRHYVDGYTPDANTVSEALTAYTADSDPATLAAYYDARHRKDLQDIEIDQYYRIISNHRMQGISTKNANANAQGQITADNTRTLVTAAKNESTDLTLKDLSAVWKFEKPDGQNYYWLRNANTGLTMSKTGGDMPTSEFEADNAARIQIEKSKLGAGICLLKITNTAGYAHLNSSGGGATATAMGTWSGGDDDSGNRWRLEKITSVPLTLDEAGWASLVLPYNVEVPAGVTVYYAQSTSTTNGALELTEWETEVIPANTPVFLNGTPTEEPLDLVITTEAATTEIEGNQLTGATMRRTKSGGNWGVYGLKKNAGVLAAAAATLETLPANRAFIALASAQAAEVRFAFGDLTGVEEVPAAALQAKEVYYDLSGRRVWAPKNGIFVTASGKKVFIK